MIPHDRLRSVQGGYAIFLVSTPNVPLALAKAKLMLLYASYKTQKGSHTQSMLKKTRYTQRYMKLLVSRFGFPDSHSGAKVMKPKVISHCSRLIAYEAEVLTTIKLPCSQHTRPKPQSPPTIPPSHQLANIRSQRSSTKHRQQFEADDSQIRPCPSLIRFCILLPQFCRRTCAILTSVQSICVAHEIHAGGCQARRMWIVA